MRSSLTPESGTWPRSRARGARPASHRRGGERLQAGARDRSGCSSRSRRPRHQVTGTRIVRGNLEATRYASPGGSRGVRASVHAARRAARGGVVSRYGSGLPGRALRWGTSLSWCRCPCPALGPASGPELALDLTGGGGYSPRPDEQLSLSAWSYNSTSSRSLRVGFGESVGLGFDRPWSRSFRGHFFESGMWRWFDGSREPPDFLPSSVGLE